MDTTYPEWLCPRLPYSFLVKGEARQPHILYDEDTDGIEAEERREKKARRLRIPTL